MKKVLSIITAATALFFGSIGVARAAGNVCFCHSQPPDPGTICTDDSGQQNGHLQHGDIPFGCECGDGVCSPEFGEDCGTCPTDCGVCATCGDQVADPLLLEECGEPGLSCVSGQCYGCRCLLTCGNGVVETGEQCDGGSCCTADCTLSTGACDDGNACTLGENCQTGVCEGGSPVDCSDGNTCTSDSCDSISGCQYAAVACSDGDVCSLDSCDPVTGCQGSLRSCEDGNACTVDGCGVSGDCESTAVDCDDGDGCTVDTCDAEQGCLHTFDASLPGCGGTPSSGIGISGCQLMR